MATMQAAGPAVQVAGRVVWAWRRELAAPAAVAAVAAGGQLVAAGPLGWTCSTLATTTVVAVPVLRRRAVAWVGRGRMLRRLRAGLSATRTQALAGRLPRVARVRATPVGTRVTLALRPGQSALQMEARLPELAAATRARVVRLVKDPATAHRIHLDVVTRDPLATLGPVPWADAGADVLSMFDPVHLGLSEDGRPVRLSMVERSLLVVGLPGVGKSSLVQLVVSHAALSPDAVLVCIDPSEVQLAPWRDRAWLYAGADMDDALAVAGAVQAEMGRRLEWLRRQPGVTRKVSRESGLPLLVFVIDELAYHLSVAGTGQQRAAFGAMVRDVVARGRAAGIVPVVATQRPTSDVVPTSLSGLFALRAAGRVAASADSDRVLGDGLSKAGWDASTIGIADRGVLIATSEDAPAQRFKAAWVDDGLIAELSATTIRHRPASPVRAGVAA